MVYMCVRRLHVLAAVRGQPCVFILFRFSLLNNIYIEKRFPNIAVTTAAGAIETLRVHFEHTFYQSGSVIFLVGAHRNWLDAIFSSCFFAVFFQFTSFVGMFFVGSVFF